jgi:hypothetical protein
MCKHVLDRLSLLRILRQASVVCHCLALVIGLDDVGNLSVVVSTVCILREEVKKANKVAL